MHKRRHQEPANSPEISFVAAESGGSLYIPEKLSPNHYTASKPFNSWGDARWTSSLVWLSPYSYTPIVLKESESGFLWPHYMLPILIGPILGFSGKQPFLVIYCRCQWYLVFAVASLLICIFFNSLCIVFWESCGPSQNSLVCNCVDERRFFLTNLFKEQRLSLLSRMLCLPHFARVVLGSPSFFQRIIILRIVLTVIQATVQSSFFSVLLHMTTL